MHAQARLSQCVMQGVGKAPGAVVFAAHQNNGVGRLRCAVFDNSGHRLPALPPCQGAGDAHQGHAQRAQAQQQTEPPQAFARVQLIEQLIGVARATVGLKRQQRAIGLIDIAVALGGAQRINVCRIVRGRVDQLAQVIEVCCPQRRQGGHGCWRATRHLGGKVGFVLHAVRDEAEGGRRHVKAG